MKKLLAYSLLATFVAYGCQVKEVIENTQESQPEAKVFTAVIEDNTSGDTKTSLDGEGNVLWKQGDQVSIFAGSTVNEQYQVSDASDGKTAATLNKVGGGGFVAGTEIDNNVAFYPYASTAEIAKSGSNYVISEIELPATQNYAAGSFGNGAFPMVAVTSSTEDMNLKFKNILGGLKLQLKGTATITSITITGKNNEKLYGEAEVTVAYGGTPSISLTNADAKTVTLDCGAGVPLNTETATPFIIALPPITMTGGFTVLVTDSEGKHMEISTSKSQTIPRSSLLRMPVVNYVGTNNYLAEPLTFTSNGSTTVSFNKKNTPDDITLEYRIGSGDWESYTIGSGIILANGESLQFRAGVGGNEMIGKSSSNYYYYSVSGTGTVEASGNIMSLLDRDLQRSTLSNDCFAYLFTSCAKLISAANLKLPATTLAYECYSHMFSGCTGLTSAPELPATTLASGCYTYMFSDCTGLISAPELPATTLASSCYSFMFQYCSSLTTAPELPSTTLASGCYSGMFYGCAHLTTAPVLPATTLQPSCYSSMFNRCYALTTAPVLPATTLVYNCYETMFTLCSHLNYIKMLGTNIYSSGNNCLNGWVSGVSATGTFVKSKDATWNVTGTSGIPDGWTVETE